ncbi:hypothetical protein QT231_24050 [Halomonas sp. SpR1]|uniref:hypothetical protein n=1 Tax=Halomonas sp. SpR1 TaxID=3050462 RepID=UPI0027E3EB85|nr:hypothetical protein [Halomonas sp. SpR1]MDQ7735777.1 hypothetical protein [Halomonas sp. SpR1]
MATPADMPPLITVEKLTVNKTQGVLTVESAQEGLESFNARSQEKPMPFQEFVNILLILNGFGATEITATFAPLQPGAQKMSWTLIVASA